ncbi:MAG TPA: copper resistance protein CopC [Chloroflexota bacterium]
MLRGLRLVGAAVVVLVLGLAGASSALAHAQYSSSTPASNSTASAAPTTLAVTFTEELASIQINVAGPHGSEVTTGRASIDLAHRTNASVALRDDGPGVYTVVWHNVSGDDGDPNDGSFVFSVSGAAAPTTSPVAQCVDTGQITPGVNDVRVNTYCKRQAIRDTYKGQIDEKTFNFDLSEGVGLDNALADAMGVLKGGVKP